MQLEYNKISRNKFNLFADDDSYLEFRQAIIDAPRPNVNMEHLPFDNITLPKREYTKQIPKVIQSLLPSVAYSDKHLFYLFKKGVCRAYGYYDPETKYFIICKGSLISETVTAKYEATKSGKTRVNFIREVCKKNTHFYRVKKDATCISPTAAASYVLGRTGRYTEWKDINGNMISTIFSDYFNKALPEHVINLVFSLQQFKQK